jgi:D-alanine-D-alanine ligase
MSELRTRKIGVLLGGRSSEREISLRSGEAILRSLKRMGYRAVPIDVDTGLPEVLKREGIEVAFIALHGRFGEDGTVQGLLEILGIPYTGTGVAGSAVATDKALTKHLLTGMGIETPSYKVIKERGHVAFPLPFVVKPAREGSTIGVSIVKNESDIERSIEEAFRFDQKVLLESYVEGREITQGIVNGLLLPLIEIRPKRGFYDFISKYTKGMTDYIFDVELDRAIREKIRDQTLKIVEAMEIKGASRIDMVVSGEKVYVLEINTSPGMTETSLVPLAWRRMGRGFDELVEEILKSAGLKA